MANGQPNVDSARVNQAFEQDQWTYSEQVLAVNIRLETVSEITKSIITVNNDYPFCYGNCPTEVSFEKVIAHEMGHFMGLSHSEISGDLMFANYQMSTLSSTPTDLAELRKILP